MSLHFGHKILIQWLNSRDVWILSKASDLQKQ